MLNFTVINEEKYKFRNGSTEYGQTYYNTDHRGSDKNLKSGDYVYITGTIYVARDAAHKRMIEALERGENLPIDIKDSTIYYMGPSPAREDVR